MYPPPNPRPGRKGVPNPVGKTKMKDPWADPTRDDFPLKGRPNPASLINKRGKAGRGVSRREAGLPTRYEQSGAKTGVNPAGKAAAGFSRREAGLATRKDNKKQNLLPEKKKKPPKPQWHVV